MDKNVRLVSYGNYVDFEISATDRLIMADSEKDFFMAIDYEGVGVLIRTLEELRKDMRKGPKIVIPDDLVNSELGVMFGKKSEPAVSNEKVFGWSAGQMQPMSATEPVEVNYTYTGNPKTLGEQMQEEMTKAEQRNAEKQGKRDEDFITFEKKAEQWRDKNKKDEK